VAGREEIVTRLVRNVPVSEHERALLGGFVTRDEIVQAIERELEHGPRFPARGPFTRQIELTRPGARLVVQRFSKRRFERFDTARQAVDRFVDLEFGPSCGGVAIVRTGPDA
jgi:hypothetical protein